MSLKTSTVAQWSEVSSGDGGELAGCAVLDDLGQERSKKRQPLSLCLIEVFLASIPESPRRGLILGKERDLKKALFGKRLPYEICSRIMTNW
jgi:hypothetical protein